MSEAPQGIYPLADDETRRRWGVREVVEGALAGGARVVQLRLKRSRDREALELVRWAAAGCRASGVRLIVNDRFDLADLGGAHGVHLGQDDLAPEEIPPELRARLVVGLSTHTLEQVRESRRRPVDYIGFGPVYPTPSKDSEYSQRGCELLQQAVELAGHPVTAIGGIGAANIRDVARTGAAAAAVISAISEGPDPAEATRRLQAAFAAARGS